MNNKISFRKVKIQEKRKIKFTWDKILLLALVGAFILFYSLMTFFAQELEKDVSDLTKGIKNLVIAFLVLLAIVALALVVYRERKKIKRDIELGLVYETRLFRRFTRHKTSILTFFLIVVAGLLLYLIGFYEFLALKLSEAILWFKAYSSYVYYVILGLIFVIILVNLAKDKKIGERFREWKKRKNIKKFFRGKYLRGLREAEKSFSGITRAHEKKRSLTIRLFSRIPFFAQELKKDVSDLTKGIKKEIPEIASEIEKKSYKAFKVSEKDISGFFSVFGRKIKKPAEKIVRYFREDEREIPREIHRAGKFILKEKRRIGEEGARLIQKTEKMVEGIYDDVGRLLSKIFKRRTRKIVLEDFEEHFAKKNKKIARKHRETLQDIIRLKEAFAKKKIMGISHEFEREIHDVRKRAAILIHDLREHIRNNNLIASEKEKKRVEEKAKMYEREISFIKRNSGNIFGSIKRFFEKIGTDVFRPKSKEQGGFKNPFSIKIGKNIFRPEKSEGFKNPFEMPGKEKRKPRRAW